MLGKIIETITEINDVINEFVWVKIGLIMLIGTGILLTVLTRFFQVRHLGHWWKETIGTVFKKDSAATKKTDKKSISQFQSLCTALAATIGTGNIAGVAAAIVIGGPGAVFWMWVAAFLGMMTNYSENLLGIYYRRKNKDGEWSGGPMYYLKDGLGKMCGYEHIGSILAVLFSIFAILASFGIGNMGQVNKITLNIESAFLKNVDIGSIVGTRLDEVSCDILRYLSCMPREGVDAGLFMEGTTTMIISRGIGNSAFPFRFNNRPEVILVELESDGNEIR